MDSVRFLIEQRKLKGLITIAGGADDVSEEFLKPIIEQIMKKLKEHQVGCLTTGTKWGVSRLTIEHALKYDIPTIRIYPEKALRKGYLAEEETDIDICVEPSIGDSEWGDESEYLIKYADGIIFLGGGAGTLTEFSRWVKINESRVGGRGRLIHGVPVVGLGGLSDWVYSEGNPFTDKIRECYPSKPISRGNEAVSYLAQKLSW